MPQEQSPTAKSFGRIFLEGGVFALGWYAASELIGLAKKGFNGASEDDDSDTPFDTDEDDE